EIEPPGFRAEGRQAADHAGESAPLVMADGSIGSFELEEVIDGGVHAFALVVLLVVGGTRAGPRRIDEGELAFGAAVEAERDVRVVADLFSEFDGFDSAHPAGRPHGFPRAIAARNSAEPSRQSNWSSRRKK